MDVIIGCGNRSNEGIDIVTLVDMKDGMARNPINYYSYDNTCNLDFIAKLL
jgi:hypothetical protein